MHAELTRPPFALRAYLAQRLPHWLAQPSALTICVLLGVLLTSPSLWMGLIMDDNFHWAMMRSNLIPPVHDASVFGLFSWFDGTEERNALMRHLGFLDWESPANYKMMFWRPISELTHWLDYRVFDKWPALMHLQSLAWYAVAILAAARLYRRFFQPSWVALLAVLLFAIDSSHALAVAIVNTRNAMLAMLFGCLAIASHDYWRREGALRHCLMGMLCFALSLGSGEAGLGVAAYLFSYALFLDKSSMRQRVLSLLPYLLVGVVWLAIYVHYGFGTTLNAFNPLYIDPVRQPLQYLSGVLQRVPVLLAAQLALPPSEIYSALLAAGMAWVYLLLAVLILIAFVMAMWPVIKTSSTARFWALGMLLSTLPVCAALPGDRLLVIIGIGGNALLAQGFAYWLGAGERAVQPMSAFARFVFPTLFVINLGISPLLMPLTIAGFGQLDRKVFVEPALGVADSPNIANETWFIIDTPSIYATLLLLPIRVANHRPIPKMFRMLSVNGIGGELSRVSTNQLILRPEKGYQFNPGKEMFTEIKTGQKFHLEDMTAEVVEMTGANPKSVLFTFAGNLDDSQYRWFVWRNDGYQPVRLPVVGVTQNLQDMQSKLPATR